MKMGRPGTGVQALKRTIRVRYTVRHRRYSETIHLEPTVSNLAKVGRMMQRVYREIELGTFSRADYFPKPVEDLKRRFSHYADKLAD